ncbi:MAG: hypothetical protein M0P43_10865 [Arcobacteraceae bacterium]|nr:hypothetical protein [Arcobacteraceae bacterium]
MTQILKRLEIIKSSIAIEDEEIIELQIIKLNKLEINDDVKNILHRLQNSEYSLALKIIEVYLSKYSGLILYEDKEIAGFKLELKSLESTLQTLIEQKTECLNDIEEFNREYSLRLGSIIREVLNLRKKILYKKTIEQQNQKKKYQEDLQTFEETQQTIDEIKKAHQELQEELSKLEAELETQKEELEKTKEFIEDETIEEEYEEAQAHYDEYEHGYKQIKESLKDVVELSDDDKAELKKLYKKAARLCHPDIVPDELKEKANEMMQLLNEAYAKKDLPKVKEILYSLENGTVFERSSDAIEDKELLKAKIEEYKQNIKNVESELEEIKQDGTYQTIAKLDDWDEYFEELKSELEKEKEQLEEEDREVLNEKAFFVEEKNKDPWNLPF